LLGGGSGKGKNFGRDNSNPVPVDVIQAQLDAAVWVDVGGLGFDAVCCMTQDATELLGLIIIGDTKRIIVDADGDVDDVIHCGSFLSGGEGESLREPRGSGRDSGWLDLDDIEVGISLMDVVDAVVEIDTFCNGHELYLAGLPVLEDQIKGKHGVLRTKWRGWVAPWRRT
jgi:hypothetical protein